MGKNKKKIFNIIIIGIIVLSMAVAGVLAVSQASEPEEDSAAAVYEEKVDWEHGYEIAIQDGQMTVSVNGKALDDAQAEAGGLSFDGATLKIQEEGTYILSGSLNGKVEVMSSKKDEVVLVLKGFTAENQTEEAIEVKKTGSLLIYLAEDTGNVFTSGEQAEINETSAEAAQDASGGAVIIKADTVIAGPGSLTVNGYINNGIQGSKCLTVASGKVNVYAVNNGIKIKDTLTVDGGEITVLSGNDAIRAEQEAQEATEEVVDETTGEVLTEAQDAEEEMGTLIINDGQITVDSYGDAIQAQLSLTINGGSLSLKTEGEYATAETQGDSGWGKGDAGWDFSQSSENVVSEKGLKSNGPIIVNGGTIMINTVDDAVHSAEKVVIKDGNLTISTGDDGIHSDAVIDISGGTINLITAYEGIEANQINISGGDLSMNTTDDGFNGNGGPESFGGPGDSNGQAADAVQEDRQTPNLNISGGSVYVNSIGDGLDSNGNITISGGYTVVDGPTSSFNGPIDGGSENGGVISISGGTIFAGGASGMAETFERTSTQYSFRCYLPSTYREGTEVRIYGPDGSELFSHTVQSSGDSIVFSSGDLKEGETYTLQVGESSYTITITGISTSVSASEDGTTTEGGSGGGSSGGPGRDRQEGDSPEDRREDSDENAQRDREAPQEGDSPDGKGTAPEGEEGRRGPSDENAQQGQEAAPEGESPEGPGGQSEGNAPQGQEAAPEGDSQGGPNGQSEGNAPQGQEAAPEGDSPEGPEAAPEAETPATPDSL